MGTIKPLVLETLHLISEFIQEVEGAELVRGHSLTYQLGDDDASCNVAAYILSLEKLISNLKTIVLNLKSKTASQPTSSTHKFEVSSDNDSSEESQGSPEGGSEIPGSQMSTTTQYGLPADIKVLDKHPVLDSMVDDANNAAVMVLPPNNITPIPSSTTLPETLLHPSFPATFSAPEHQQPQMRSMTDPPLISDASVNMNQAYSDSLRMEEDITQYPKCIKCGGAMSSEGEGALSGGGGILDTCTQCSSIADSVSKRRRRKTVQDDTSGRDSSGGDNKGHESTSKKHSCEKCGRVFSKWKHLSIHYTKVHMDEDGGEGGNSELISNNNTLPLYCCKTCNLACLSVNSFNTHTCRLPTDDENPASSLSNRILITNVLKLHKLRKFVCEMCGVEYRTFKRITYHLPRCSPGPYPCNVCTVLFTTQKELNYHKRKMHKDEKCFVCEECGKSFQRRTSLQKHAVNWHESSSALGPFKCDLCPKKFIRRIYLTNHKLRMHGLDKKFLCQVCGNKFMTQNSLMTHMEVHSDQKRFECSYCKKKFKRKEKLKYHERIHTGERPFQCQLCAHGFVSKTKLDEHVSRHRGDRRYRCSFCTKTYAGAYDLKQHIRKVHDKPCDKVAVTVVAPSQPSTSGTNLTQVQVLDPLAIATAASGLKEEEVVTCGSTSSLPQPQASASLPTLEEVGGGMVGGGQYITMTGQQAVAIPVVGSVQGHLPSIGHVVQVSGSTVPLTGVSTALGTGGTSVQAVQTIPGVTTTEYSVQTLPPQAVHTAQGYIFTQGFDMVSGAIQY